MVGHFLEEQDEEAMQKELKEAFRLYDKEGKVTIHFFLLRSKSFHRFLSFLLFFFPHSK